jgi:hypothetical protein
VPSRSYSCSSSSPAGCLPMGSCACYCRLTKAQVPCPVIDWPGSPREPQAATHVPSDRHGRLRRNNPDGHAGAAGRGPNCVDVRDGPLLRRPRGRHRSSSALRKTVQRPTKVAIGKAVERPPSGPMGPICLRRFSRRPNGGPRPVLTVGLRLGTLLSMRRDPKRQVARTPAHGAGDQKSRGNDTPHDDPWSGYLPREDQRDEHDGDQSAYQAIDGSHVLLHSS